MDYWYISVTHYLYVSVATMVFCVVGYLLSIRATRHMNEADRVDYNTMGMIGIMIISWVPILQMLMSAAAIIFAVILTIVVLNDRLRSFDKRINNCLKK